MHQHELSNVRYFLDTPLPGQQYLLHRFRLCLPIYFKPVHGGNRKDKPQYLDILILMKLFPFRQNQQKHISAKLQDSTS